MTARFLELFEGDNLRLSMRAVITYAVTFTLCAGVLAALYKDDGGTAMGLAGILSTLVGTIYGIGKVVDGSVTKSSMPTQPQSVNVENVETVTVSNVPVVPENKPKG